jgi:adenylate cyclase
MTRPAEEGIVADPALRPAAVTGLAAFALGLAFLILDPGGAATRLREEAFDAMAMRIAPKRAPEGVVVVDIDRASLAAKGSWPWRRGALAAIVEHIQSAKPKVIGIDILLSGPDRRAPGPFVQALAKETGRKDLAALIGALPDDDKDLAEVIARSDVVLGLLLDDASREAPPFPAPVAAIGKPSQQRLEESAGVAPPLASLAESAVAVGALSLQAGPGARVRDAPIFVRGAGEIYAGFALEVFRVAENASAFVLEDDGNQVAIGNHKIPLREGATMRLHLAPAESWAARTLSAADVLDGKAPAARFADRIVLIGTSAPEAGALLSTAAQPLTPTVQLQAEAIEELRAGHLLERIVRPGFFEPGAAAVLGLIALGSALLLGPLLAAFVLAALIVAWVGTSLALFSRFDLLVDPAGPLIPAVLASNGAALVLFAHTRKLRNAIERKFGRYLSPEIVRRLTAAPEELKIEGELREVTALFSDIEGFTTMSERAEPRTLVGALDAYFEGVCAIVIKHGGMVDKIVGDAVHGLFNAPLDLPNHARAALDCAIDIGRFTDDFRRRLDAQELCFGRTRIGFETGPVIVGDVGGLGHLDYTAHGDAVNSAARLEAINKQFGTTICLGARAAAAIGEPDRLRPLGSVTLRGRGSPTEVYSPWPDDTTPERRDAYLAAHRAVEAGAPEAVRLFEALARDWPCDPATGYWVELLRAGAPAQKSA